MYQTSVAVHVVAAIVGFGATFTYPVIQLTAERRDPSAIPFALGAILAISRWVAVPATLVVGATGVYQVGSGPYSFGDTWIAVSLVLYAAVMLLGIFYFAPAYRRAARPAVDYRAALRGPTVLGPLVAAAIVAIAVPMALK